MKFFKLQLIFILFGCGNDVLHKVCPPKCYPEKDEYGSTIDPQTADVGVCKSGVPTCDDDYNIIKCDGVIIPSKEICDGSDNNCDGHVDELLYSGRIESWFNDDNPCLRYGECADGHVSCNNGAWVCTYPSTVEMDGGNVAVRESRCDGLDNNCDGIVDNIVFDSPACYTGPIGSDHSPCSPGWIRCTNGELVCDGEHLPSPESCDLIDNDCNGVVDDTSDVLSSLYDIVFGIDTSGSMCDKIEAVLLAIDQYVDAFNNDDNYKFALVLFSSNVYSVWLEQDFADIVTFRNRLLSLTCSGGGNEASYDVIYDVCDKSINPLGLSWRDDAIELYFGFTDEPAQSGNCTYTNTGDVLADAAAYRACMDGLKQSIADECLSNNILVFQWANSAIDFQDICDQTNGLYFDISGDYNDILNDLNSIIITLCNDTEGVHR